MISDKQAGVESELSSRPRDVASESPQSADVAGCAAVDRPDSVAVDRRVGLAIAVEIEKCLALPRPILVRGKVIERIIGEALHTVPSEFITIFRP